MEDTRYQKELTIDLSVYEHLDDQ